MQCANTLTKLLHYFSVHLLREECHELRLAISRHIPSRQLSDLPANGIGIFDELVNRKLISLQNLDLLEQIFCEIRRFDYIHLIDCVKEGDNSLLDGLYYEDQELPNDTGASNSQSVATVQEICSPIVREPRVEDASSFQMKQDGSVSRDIGDDQGTLSRRYNNSPTVSQVSLTLPIQEVSRSASHAGNNHTGSCHGGSNRGKQAEQGLSGGNNAETRAKFSCEHYDRYCHVQFSCCDKFWPCHRCHNMKNTCGNGKLRSIDIKKIKCRRCQRIQEFPKERPNCEECGLKLAEYFCALCQHLTGRKSNPYHCVGCGICRINEDRSFHCDVCGVCLDIQLLENHKCRAGSAHDKCCICFKDAFTGCQILPCSHKVHKECATEMLKSGITNTVGTECLP